MSSQEEQSMASEATGFDIAVQKEVANQEDEGSLVHIESVEGEPLYFKDEQGLLRPVQITIAGTHSSLYRKAEARIRGKKLRGKITGETLFRDQIEKVVACITHWQGFTSNGQTVNLTPHNAKMLLETCPWVLEQLVEAMNDHERFFKRG